MSLTQVSGNMITSNTTFSNIVASNGLYSVGNYNGSFSDGIVVDYVTGNGRISVGSADALTFYNGGVASSALMTLDASGNLGIGSTSIANFGSGSKGLTINGTGNYQNIAWQVNGTSIALAYTNGAGGGFLIGTEASVPLIFTTVGTERARIDSSGRMQIGGTTAYDSSTLSVTSTTGQNKVAAFDGGGSGARARLFINMPALNTAMLDVDQSTGILSFGVNGSEKARIDSSGNLLVGVTSSQISAQAGGLQISWGGLGAVNRQTKAFIAGSYSSSSGLPQMVGNWSSGGQWAIGSHSGTTDSTVRIGITTTDANGIYWNGYANVQAGTYTNSSDYRIKENVNEYSVSALPKILSLRPVTFKIINGNGRTEVGFLAHEIQEHIPEVVTGLKDEIDEHGEAIHQGVDYAKFTAVLTKAIQELSAELNELKQKVN